MYPNTNMIDANDPGGIVAVKVRPGRKLVVGTSTYYEAAVLKVPGRTAEAALVTGAVELAGRKDMSHVWPASPRAGWVQTR